MKILQYCSLALLLLTMNAYSHTTAKDGLTQLLQDPEIKILDISDHLYDGEFDAAEQELKKLIAQNPKFSLAQLMYAELITTKSGMMPGFSGWLAPQNHEVASLVEEIRRRHAHNKEISAYADGKVPDFLLQLSPSQKHVVVVDSSASRALVFENRENQLSLVNDYYITVGKNGVLKNTEGDGRTPVGVYFITSRLNPLGLDDLYGDGALPLNYPNEWDQRMGRSGFGIWLHGVPSDTYNRAPFATQGCVAFPNKDIALLYNKPEIENSPVIITQQINWVGKAQNTLYRISLAKQIGAWKKGWESGNINSVSRYYADSFRNGKFNREDWLQTQNKFVTHSGVNKFTLSDVSMFKYPGAPRMVVVSFSKQYAGENAAKSSRIRQYWQLDEQNVWGIVYEGSAQYQPIHFRGIPRAVRPTLADEVQRLSQGLGS